ncbi:MAG: glycosyltransferase family 39 protein [Bacteroidales bacterium]|nr:glycosyltransferase family 39 protein [Bacteroidales bacterium]
MDRLAPRLGLRAGRQLGWLIMLLLLCIGSLWLFLGDTLFNTRGEPREALVSMAMVNTNDWILPITNGVDLAYKPPFFHWCGALTATLYGEVSEFTSRFPSALGLTLIVLSTFTFYAKRRSKAVALLTALITLTNFELHRAGVAARVDMVLTTAIVIALFALYRWCERGLSGVPWIASLAMSAAFLTKGPVGLVLPCLVAGIFAWWRIRSFWSVLWRFTLLAITSCILPLTWYMAAYAQGGEAFWQLVYEENVLRFLGKMSYASHENPWHYNLLTIIAGFLPYTLVVATSVFVLPWKHWIASLSRPTLSWWHNTRHYLSTMDSTRLYTLLCIVVMFIFYCIPKSKRSTYLMPLYPFIAYYLAEYLPYLWRTRQHIVVWFGRFVAFLCVLLPIVYLLIHGELIAPEWLGERKLVLHTFMFQALRDTAWSTEHLTLLILPLGIAIYWLSQHCREERYWSGIPQRLALIPVMLVGIFMALDGLYQPAILGAKSSYGFVQQIKDITPRDTLYYYDNDFAPGNRMHPFTANFYLNGRLVPFIEFGQQHTEGYVLIGNDDIEAFIHAYPQLRLTSLLSADRPSPDDNAYYTFYRFTIHQEQ